jgi:hypothetical protein
MLVGEFQDLDLRCLANSCPGNDLCKRKLVSLFEQGLDPAWHAAAALHDLEQFRANGAFYESFAAIEREDPPTFNAWMNITGTILRFAPRGISSELITRLIREKHGEETWAIVDRFLPEAYGIVLEEIFPELNGYCTNPTVGIVGSYLSMDPAVGFYEFAEKRDGFAHHLREVIAGRKQDTQLLARLLALCRNEEMKQRIQRGSSELYDEIFRRPQLSGYGRIRAMLEYQQLEASAHLDRIDDIIKSTLYCIVDAGYDLVAFAGDEFVLLVPDRHPRGGLEIDEVAHDVEKLVVGVIGRFLRFVPARCRVTPRSEW